MDVLIFSIVSIPFLVGMGLLIWGFWRLYHVRAERAEQSDREASITIVILIFGCLPAAGFFQATLAAARVPLAWQIGIVAALSVLLFILGEWHIRSAVIYKHDVTPGAPWLAFLGVLSPAIYLPAWIRLLEPFSVLYVACLFIALPLGQYLLIKRWRYVRKKMLRTLEDS